MAPHGPADPHGSAEPPAPAREPEKPLSPEYVPHLRDAAQNAARDLDRVVLGVSTGALALSLTFLRDLQTSPNFPALLQTAWAFLLFSTTSLVLSLIFSGLNIRLRLRNIHDGQPEGKRFRWTTRALTNVSCATALAGVGFLVAFASLNI